MKRLIQKKLKETKENLYYMLAALMIGLIVGSIDALFGRVLLAITDFRGKYVYILVWFLPVAGLFITWMYHRFNETSLKGMTLVLETAQGKRENIPLALVPLVMIGTWITHLFGGSAGREGVAVQIGAIQPRKGAGAPRHSPDVSLRGRLRPWQSRATACEFAEGYLLSDHVLRDCHVGCASSQ